MVERRDQVLITCFLFSSLSWRIFFNKCSSAKGPFFKLRPMTEPPFVIVPRPVCETAVQSRYFLRRWTINLSDGLFFLRVLYPRVGLPHGVFGVGRPIGALPSPPPCG